MILFVCSVMNLDHILQLQTFRIIASHERVGEACFSIHKFRVNKVNECTYRSSIITVYQMLAH